MIKTGKVDSHNTKSNIDIVHQLLVAPLIMVNVVYK